MRIGRRNGRWRNKILALERWRRRLERERLSHRRRALSFIFRPGVELLRAPKIFALENSAGVELLHFMSELRSTVAELGKGTVVIDFTKTIRMYAGGTLYFTSELQLLLDVFPEVSIRCRKSHYPVVNEVLVHLGIFAQLKHSSGALARRHDVTSWKKATGDDVDLTGAGQTIEAYESLTKEAAKLLFKGASEAISNVVAHAYEMSRESGYPQARRKAWYLFCREDSNDFFLAICDLGAGIPETLTRKHPQDLINRVLNMLAGRLGGDADMIEAAMEIARTRTRNPYQGLGLQDFKSVVDGLPGASLHIYSNAGAVVYRNGKKVGKRKLSTSIGGTIVLWRVPI